MAGLKKRKSRNNRRTEKVNGIQKGKMVPKPSRMDGNNMSEEVKNMIRLGTLP